MLVMRLVITLIFVFANVLTNHEIFGANILMIFPAPSYSHTIAARVIANELVGRGHIVTILTTDARPMNHPNITHIDLSFSYQLWNDGFDFVAYKENSIGIENMIEKFADTIYHVLQLQLSSPGVQDLIKHRSNMTFDLVMVEAMGFLPYHTFAELFNAPLMGFNSFDAPMDFHMSQGNYVNPFVVNEAALFPNIGQLTFFQRWDVIKRLAKIAYTVVIKPDLLNRYYYLQKKYFPMSTLTPFELLDKVEFLMVNTHPALGFIRPLVPTTIQLGFIHIEKAKPLPNELQRYMDASKRGVIYMSLGSNVKASRLNQKYVKIFLNVFESLDYDVIWKWETNEMENKPKNVLLSKWLPQRDLLEHSNLKLFITQGGHQSMEEAIHCKVPVLVIPFLGDQDANANRLEQLGVALQLDLLKMNEENLRERIVALMKPEYRENMENLHELVYDQPMTSLSKAIFWIEYVIRHKGAKHLEFKGKHVPFYQAYCLDFIAIFIILSIILYNVSRRIIKKILKTFPLKSIKNKNKTE